MKGWGQAGGGGQCFDFLLVLWQCWFGNRKDIPKGAALEPVDDVDEEILGSFSVA